jgi:hypothetical protein
VNRQSIPPSDFFRGELETITEPSPEKSDSRNVALGPHRADFHFPSMPFIRSYPSPTLPINCLTDNQNARYYSSNEQINEPLAVADHNSMENRPNPFATLCVALAFVPGAISVVYIHFDLGSSHVLLNPITLAAFFWLGMTYLHFRHAKTRSAAWIFALFPVAFAEPILFLCLWISVKYSTK